VEFVPRFVHPLGTAELHLLHKQTGAVDLQFEADDPSVNGERKSGRATIRTTITFGRQPIIFALVRGGWLPLPLAIPPRFLVDRNIVIALRKLRFGQLVERQEITWWFQFFEKGSAIFNPLPYAFEAGYRRKPTMEEFVAAYDEGVAELSRSFPKCEVVSYQSANYQGAYAQLEALDERNAAETEFLMRTCGLVANRVSRSRESKVLKRIVSTADSLGIPRASLAVLGIISCLFEDLHGTVPSIGRKVIKPSDMYSKADAFNALNDLRHIELAVAGQVYFGDDAFCLCTRDRAIAMLWCALCPRGVSPTDGAVKLTFDLTSHLVPRLMEEEILELKSLLAEQS
jgi:hypothetical protein